MSQLNSSTSSQTVVATTRMASKLAQSQMEATVLSALRSAYGTSVNRTALKAFEASTANPLYPNKVQWRANPAFGQKFRTPLGMQRIAGARGTFAIPAAMTAPLVPMGPVVPADVDEIEIDEAGQSSVIESAEML